MVPSRNFTIEYSAKDIRDDDDDESSNRFIHKIRLGRVQRDGGSEQRMASHLQKRFKPLPLQFLLQQRKTLNRATRRLGSYAFKGSGMTLKSKPSHSALADAAATSQSRVG